MKKWFCAMTAALLMAGPALAADKSGKTDASCRQETKRVTVWQHGPKASGAPRFENREVTVCDAKVSQPSDREDKKS